MKIIHNMSDFKTVIQVIKTYEGPSKSFVTRAYFQFTWSIDASLKIYISFRSIQ